MSRRWIAVTLTANELNEADTIADAEVDYAEAQPGWRSDRYHAHDRPTPIKRRHHRRGLRGERAFCKHYGIPFITDQRTRTKNRRNGDVHLPGIGPVEIKTGPRTGKYMLANLQDADEAHRKRPFVLVLDDRHSQTEFMLAGWMSGRVLFQRENLGDWWRRGRPCYRLHRSRLWPMSSLVPSTRHDRDRHARSRYMP